MELAVTASEKILVMLLIALTGFVAYKKGIITEKGNKTLTSVLLMIVNPLMIINAYQIEVDDRLMRNFIISAILAVAGHIIGILISMFTVKKGNRDFEIERLSVVYSNCGFIGIPLINGIFGMEGVLYLTAYLTVFNICLWTHGLLQVIDKTDAKTMLKNLLSPCIVCSILGLLLFIFKITLPEAVGDAVEQVAAMNSPLAMIIAGATIAQADLKKAVVKIRAYYVSILRLFIVPLACAVIFSFFGLEKIVVITSVIEAACPVAASATMFAINYDKNAVYASEIFAISTILSVVSLPIVIVLAQIITGNF
jgi:hypothetical protein